jgi:integrase/recombinase XerD
MKLSKALEGFSISLAADGYSQNTIQVYKWGLGIVEDYLTNPNVKEITSKDLIKFMAWVQSEYIPDRKNKDKSPLSPASIENIWIAIRSFFNWAENELKLQRPDLSINRPKYSPPITKPLTKKEIQLLPKATRDSAKRLKNRDRAILLVLLDTGIRVSELARLRIRDVDLETGSVEVIPYGSRNKTKPRMVFIGKATRKLLWLYLSEREETSPTDPVFLSIDNRPMNRNSIRIAVKRLAKSAGLDDIYPHKFRHTFAVQFLRNGGNIYTLQRLLGHSSLEMVKRYLKLSETDTEQAHRQASPVDRWRL